MDTLFWFRRDLRVLDNAGLYYALKKACMSGGTTYCIFVFDENILKHLPIQDRRITFIWDSLLELNHALRQYGGHLIILNGQPTELIPLLARCLNTSEVYINHDDEPQSLNRDTQVAHLLKAQQHTLYTYKDHIIFERNEIMTQHNSPYRVFTPYKTAWLKQLNTGNGMYTQSYEITPYTRALNLINNSSLSHLNFNLNCIHTLNTVDIAQLSPAGNISVQLCYKPTELKQLGFDDQYKMSIPAGSKGANILLNDFINRIENYAKTRNFPAIKGTSYLSVHLRFGTISIRQLVNRALQYIHTEGGKSWLNELIWRDFYHQIMYHYPQAMTQSFKPEYDRIVWNTGIKADALFLAWCQGNTGYPLVDAAQRQLNQTGYMHNRLRMVSACFLVKDLGIDWRRGESYFAKHLNDFDLAANNGGWQWAASTGCDAQPYFRIFNPITQSKTFDEDGKFIRQYIPEIAHLNNQHIHTPWLSPSNKELFLPVNTHSINASYPLPIIDHSQARLDTLKRYTNIKTSTKQ